MSIVSNCPDESPESGFESFVLLLLEVVVSSGLESVLPPEAEVLVLEPEVLVFDPVVPVLVEDPVDLVDPPLPEPEVLPPPLTIMGAPQVLPIKSDPRDGAQTVSVVPSQLVYFINTCSCVQSERL